MLVAAMNPCPCGYYPDHNKCRCTDKEVHRYVRGVSGPLLNRIDLSVNVLRSSYEQVKGRSGEESSALIRQRVLQARNLQEERNGKGIFNSRIPVQRIMQICSLTKEAEKTMEHYYTSKDLSMRGYHRLLRVARTIADISGSEQIEEPHILEAAGYRGMLDK
jgi:magnesium chelatase family protein